MKLRILNDPVLRKPTEEVNLEDLRAVVDSVPEMINIMNEEGGVGLSANQVGISKRYFIMKRSPDSAEVEVIINPRIIDMGPLEKFEEGCLSIPGVSAETQRAKSLKLFYRDESFEEKMEEFTDFAATVVQHEVDHLDGKLYIDQLKPLKKMMLVDKHRKYLKKLERHK